MNTYVIAGIVIVLALIAEVWRRRTRLRRTPVPPGFERTDELFTDPTTGVKQRVWYNPQTGERHYEILSDKGEQGR